MQNNPSGEDKNTFVRYKGLHGIGRGVRFVESPGGRTNKSNGSQLDGRSLPPAD
jgi:hypothetical protein